MRVFYTEEVLDRMRKLFSVSTNKELSSKLLAKETTVSSWKTRNSIPLEILLSVVNQKNVSLDYLVFGDEQKSNNSIDEDMILTAYKKIPKERKLEVMAFISGLGGLDSTNKSKSSINVNGGNGNFVGGDVNIGMSE